MHHIAFLEDAITTIALVKVHNRLPNLAGPLTMLTLYHCAETRSMRSLWLLKEMHVSFELVEMPFDIRVTRAPQYLAVHPLGRVPCLRDGDFTLFESGAIAEYLCERFPGPGLGRLSGDAERYEWLQWIHYSETVAVHAATLVQQQVFFKPADRSVGLIKLEGARLKKCLAVLEAHLQTRDYLLTTGFSAADIAVGTSIHLALPFSHVALFPALAGYYARLSQRSAFQASLPQGWERPLKWLSDLP
jgi:glutathione S-transferase